MSSQVTSEASSDPLSNLLASPKEDGESKRAGKAAQTSAQAASAAAARVRRRNRMITSCLECRRRKLKCDKVSHPCANCLKSNRDCVFLAPSLDSAAQLKLTEIKEKMGSLERVLEQDVAKNGTWRELRKAQAAGQISMEDEIDFAPIPEDEKELEPTPLASEDAVYDEDADGDLMDLGVKFGKLRMTDRVGGFFRPKISDEIAVSLADGRNDRRSPAEKQASPEPPVLRLNRNEDPFAPGPNYLPPSSTFFFPANGVGASLIDFLPAQSTADHLLQQYWHAVHPIARVVHRPSFQRRYNIFWDEVRMGIEPVGSLQAIVFAAMFSAAVSMPEDRILNDFAVSKKELMDNFQQGTETALGRANLLRTTKLETMQAMVMYMIPLCRDVMSRAHSALVGTAIRLAECMGLHKDGSAYGMSPVETHVRRIVWYQIGILDIRTCEAQGPRPGIREGEFDTQFPLNVDDNELESLSPPTASSSGWTDMSLTLIRMECTEMIRHIWFERPRLEKKQTTLTTVLGKIENFRRTTSARWDPVLDKSIPIQHAATLLLGVYINRLYIMILHRYHNSVAMRIPDRLRQIIITTGTDCIESAMLFETLPTVSPWSWIAGALQQYHTAFLLLAEVFTYPMRRESDRIWAVLDYVFEVPPALSRAQKARLILSEIRDKMGAYRDARKLKASTKMTKRLGVSAPRSGTDYAAAGRPMGKPKGSYGVDSGLGAAFGGGGGVVSGGDGEDGEVKPQKELMFPGPNGEVTVPEAWKEKEVEVGSGSGSASAGGAGTAGVPAWMAGGQGPMGGEVGGQGGAVFGYDLGSAGVGGGGSVGRGFGDGSSGAATRNSDTSPSSTDELMVDIDWNEWDKLFPPDVNTGDLNLPATTGVEEFGLVAPMSEY